MQRVFSQVGRLHSVGKANRVYLTNGLRFQSTTKQVTMVEVEVDGRKVQIESGKMAIEACELAGVEIPRFCYHERLGVAGNCRMCLVELERAPKPIASCAWPVANGMKIKTTTPLVHKARQGVMEFLLANHPLDCPVCDQGGECDLQDQAMVYGSDRSRRDIAYLTSKEEQAKALKEIAKTEIKLETRNEYRDDVYSKRAVDDKNFGPVIKTSMNRCIQCTRCVRFANEVAGASGLGTAGRGGRLEISTYVNESDLLIPPGIEGIQASLGTVGRSELSGNLADICPVGALTMETSAFRYRPWEIRGIESIDVLDAVHSNIRVDARGQEIIRVLPRLNEEINEEWLDDKARLAYDGAARQRLTTPLIYDPASKSLTPSSWEKALTYTAQTLRSVYSSKIKAIVGQQADAESIMALKDLFNALGSDNFAFEGENKPISSDFRSNYIMNSTMMGVEKADALLLIGTNPRHEAPMFNARIRKSYLNFGLNVGLIGHPAELTCEYEHLGNNTQALADFISGSSNSEFSKLWKEAKNPMVIIGADVSQKQDGNFVLKSLEDLVKMNPNLLTPEWNGINILQRKASRVACHDLGFVPGVNSNKEQAEVIYLLGADDLSEENEQELKKAFVIYQGHHGDRGAEFADIILPGSTCYEKKGTFVNTEGRVQQTRPAISTLKNARADWQILVALSQHLNISLPYTSLSQVRERMAQVSPYFGYLSPTSTAEYDPKLNLEQSFTSSSIASLGIKYLNHLKRTPATTNPFTPVIKNYYMTDPISRSSPSMARCTHYGSPKTQNHKNVANA